MDDDKSLLLILSVKGSHRIIEGECFPVSGYLAHVRFLDAATFKSLFVVFQPEVQVVLTASRDVSHVVASHGGIEAGGGLQKCEGRLNSPETLGKWQSK